jgi:signal transduction histidine kinase
MTKNRGESAEAAPYIRTVLMSARRINLSNLASKLIVTLVIGITVATSGSTLWSIRHRVKMVDRAIFSELTAGSRVLAAFLSEAGQEVPSRDRAALTARATQRLDSMGVRWLGKNELKTQTPAGLTPELMKQAEIEGEACTFVDGDGGSVGRCYNKVPTEGVLQGLIVATQAVPTRQAEINRLIIDSIVSTVVLIVACTVIAAAAARYFVAIPVRRLGDVVRRVADGDFSARLMVRQQDEVGELGREINIMGEKLQAASERVAAETEARMDALEQLRHTERLSTLGRMASSIAHELGTPLNIILGRAQLISSASTSHTATENARIISEQSHRMSQIIRDILDFARRRQPQTTQIELLDLVQKAFSLTSSAARRRHVSLQLLPESVPQTVLGDPNRVLQVVINLLMNAIQATPEEGVVEVAVKSEERPAPEDLGGPALRFATIAVKDRGVGIPADALPRIFEPFFTTKTAGEGTGLGLSIVSGIVREYGGSIDVQSEVGRGSCFTVHLPREMMV